LRRDGVRRSSRRRRPYGSGRVSAMDGARIAIREFTSSDFLWRNSGRWNRRSQLAAPARKPNEQFARTGVMHPVELGVGARLGCARSASAYVGSFLAWILPNPRHSEGKLQTNREYAPIHLQIHARNHTGRAFVMISSHHRVATKATPPPQKNRSVLSVRSCLTSAARTAQRRAHGDFPMALQARPEGNSRRSRRDQKDGSVRSLSSTNRAGHFA